MKKDKIILNEKSFEDKTFYYNDLGCARHWNPSFRLWINKTLVLTEKNENYIEFPLKGAKVEKTEKGTLVLRKDEKYNTFYLPTRSCGFRGKSWFSVINDMDALIYTFEEYESPRGNLGIKRGGIISSQKNEIILRIESNGRAGYESYYMKMDVDGNVEAIELPPEDFSLLE
jgi:hypothetical protein